MYAVLIIKQEYDKEHHYRKIVNAKDEKECQSILEEFGFELNNPSFRYLYTKINENLRVQGIH